MTWSAGWEIYYIVGLVVTVDGAVIAVGWMGYWMVPHEPGTRREKVLRDQKRAARRFFQFLFGGPVVGFLWPLVIVGGLITIVTFMGRDALRQTEGEK